MTRKTLKRLVEKYSKLKMKLVTPANIKLLVEYFGEMPSDYVEFLSNVGYGTIGEDYLQIYGGPEPALSIYGGDTEFEDIVIVVDDFAGFCLGYTVKDWSLVEVDSGDMKIVEVPGSFTDYLEKWIRDLETNNIL